MKNIFLIIIFTFISISTFAQENSGVSSQDLVDHLNNYNDQKSLAEISKDDKTIEIFSNMIPIPSFIPTDAQLYKIVEAPINKNVDYKLLNLSGEKVQHQLPLILKK